MRLPASPVYATLLRRYQRFLVDVRLADGTTTTAHCANTGSMLSCSTPGSPVCLFQATNPKRRYPLGLEMVQVGGTWVGVNTARANALVVEALEAGQISEYAGFDRLRREVTTSPHTRLDLELTVEGRGSFIEVKNCSLAEGGVARFPDAVSARGSRHLAELSRLAATGCDACIFFLVQRLDADRFAPADHIDPAYGQALRRAKAAGVRVLAYQAAVSPVAIEVVRRLPVVL